MVYLYLSSHAESNQDIAILAINTLQRDCKDESPLVRGLALRSISSLKLPNIAEYLQIPIKNGLADVSAYVRKTAIIASGKLFRFSPETFERMGLTDKLYGMLRDGDPAVCCNALVVLHEALADKGGITINKTIIYFLLNRLKKDLNEWQQCLVLNLALKYVPENDKEMFAIMNLLEELLKASNSAVILSCTNVFLTLTQNNSDIHKQVYQRLKEPLLTLFSTSALETSYACLCHIRLLVSRQPEVFAPAYKDFYLRYNDPSYVRLVKLEILVCITNEKNAKEIVDELSAFATDIQVDTSRAAIKALGQIALKLPSAADDCTKYFLEMLETEQEHVRAATFVMLKDFMRKYTDPKKLKPFFASITKHWKALEDLDCKQSFIWMLGEFGENVEDAPYILELYATSFLHQHPRVRLELLTSCMKLFFKRPPEMQKILGPLINEACSDFSHADVHDRALLYYRLLVKNPRVAAEVVNGRKGAVEQFHDEETAEFKDKLFEEFNTLSVVYNLPSERFTLDPSTGIAGEDEEEEESEESSDESESDEDSEEDADEKQERGLLAEEGKKKKAKLVLQDDAEIELDDFKRLWAALPPQPPLKLKLREQPDAETVETVLGNHNITTLASGITPTTQILKFFFYAQSSDVTSETQFCLSEAVVDPAGNLTANIKGDDPRLSDFVDYFRATWKPFC
eukprot:TRINITY_DN1343_c0_g1_i1.p1 TRINITY_DN1343_c0_g1~~TRINITY_DN1343_c0_g1_i1.p1  ORF type:complete len:781 (+),score=192.30 TRINITY_DN1343_c0_g1_i1:288-2345(+)